MVKVTLLLPTPEDGAWSWQLLHQMDVTFAEGSGEWASVRLSAPTQAGPSIFLLGSGQRCRQVTLKPSGYPSFSHGACPTAQTHLQVNRLMFPPFWINEGIIETF